MTAIDEFSEYPMPQKATNWTIPNSKRHVRATPLRETNITRDIDGAVPGTTVYFKARRFTAKPNLFTTKDIPGATTHTLHPLRAKPLDTSLKTSDIERCTSGVIHLCTDRNVNPLKPSYHLPSINAGIVRQLRQEEALHAQQSPPRDCMKLSDIEGTRAKLAYTRSHPRDPLDVSDIPKHSKVHRSKRDTSMSMVTSDIMHGPDGGVAGRRHTNPLHPEYVVALPGHHTMTLGDISGSHSTPSKPLRKDQPML